jgi:hypothetical protein
MVPLVRAPRSSTHIQAITGTTRVRETMAAAETVVAETAAVTDPPIVIGRQAEYEAARCWRRVV